MKIQHLILTALVITFTGCDQKPSPSSIPTAPVNNTVQKGQKAAPQVKNEQLKTNKEQVKTSKTPVVTESSANASPTKVTPTTEQSLAEISKHGRDVTKTQESKSRTRAQEAEDEMMKDLASHK